MANLFINGKFQAIGSDGLASPGAKLYTYAAGGISTPLATYTDQGAGGTNQNPVICDAAGQADVWLGTSAYRMVLKTAAGVVIWDVDHIRSSDANLADSTSATAGSGVIGFSPTNNYVAQTIGAALKDEYINVMWLITDQTERAAILAYTSTADHTSYINAALAYGKRVYLPAGRWNVSPAVGILLPAGGSIIGDGITRSIIKALANGATSAELVAYTKGSVIKRAFTTGIAQSYVSNCYLADFSVLLTHTAPYNAGNYQQIGIDLRNITRSVVERVYVGNVADAQTGHAMTQSPSSADQTQGYGIVVGTRQSSSTDYCGGEGNTIRDCHAWGLYKNIVVDDATLSPLSAAHATLVDNCEAQGGHELITQGLQYAAGVIFRNITIQNSHRQTGNANPTIGVSMGGYAGSVHIKYAEMGTACDKVFTFLAGSKSNVAKIDYYSYSAPSTGTITDASAGNRNRITYSAAVAGVGTGAMVELYSGAPLEASYKGSWSGATETVDAANGITLTRAGAGDYTITLAIAQPNDDWKPAIDCDWDASGHLGGVALSYGTQSTTQYRFFTFSQNGGTTTQVDPRKMHIRINQAI